jgi:D-alanine-D-alanine ligase-like ATP-grasp enzyme
MIACYQRRPMSVTGDGSSTILQLLMAKQEALGRQKRPVIVNANDPRIAKKLARAGRSLASIPADGERVAIYDVSNLSTGGDAEDFTARVHPHWRDLCISLTAQLGLRLCGVDLACADIESADSAYSILETNASPGMDNYATMGAAQMQTVRDLYRRIFNESPRR